MWCWCEVALEKDAMSFEDNWRKCGIGMRYIKKIPGIKKKKKRNKSYRPLSLAKIEWIGGLQVSTLKINECRESRKQ